MIIKLGGFGGSLLSDNVKNLRKLRSLLQGFLLSDNVMNLRKIAIIAAGVLTE